MRPARACSEGDSTEGVQTLNGIRNADSEIKDETESLRWGLYHEGGYWLQGHFFWDSACQEAGS